MIFLQLNSLSKPAAIFEIVIILAVAALLGYILSRILAASKLRLLREEIEQRQIDLAECRAIPMETQSIANTALVHTESEELIEPSILIKSITPINATHPATEPVSSDPDDLKIIEGIGPKIEEILNKQGIYTYLTLSDLSAVRIAAILKNAGPRFQIHDPSSWPQQANLAKQGKWEALEELKVKLISGRS